MAAVIIHPEQEHLWILNDLTKEGIESSILPFSEEEMKAHTISKMITSRTENPNVPEVLEPYIYPELVY